MAHILVVDDEEDLLALIKNALERDGHQVSALLSGRQVDEAACRWADCILLDVMMPGEDGFSLCRRIRDMADCPVLFLTARTREEDVLTGLGAGADDYLAKPFRIAELRARVAARLRSRAEPAAGALALGPFTFDFERMDFRREGVAIELSKAEQKLLRVLVENRGHAVSRAALVDRVWTDGAQFVEENALSVTVRRLRGKLEADPARPEYLKTVYGIGYTWAVEP